MKKALISLPHYIDFLKIIGMSELIYIFKHIGKIATRNANNYIDMTHLCKKVKTPKNQPLYYTKAQINVIPTGFLSAPNGCVGILTLKQQIVLHEWDIFYYNKYMVLEFQHS